MIIFFNSCCTCDLNPRFFSPKPKSKKALPLLVDRHLIGNNEFYMYRGNKFPSLVGYIEMHTSSITTC
ncbi:hypothetical protein HanHA89_Chr08g0301581 [Helianthus annuus]|nr:hypothetical protein HanHA89_Chr08g0301581 [Helianthus annuus]